MLGSSKTAFSAAHEVLTVPVTSFVITGCPIQNAEGAPTSSRWRCVGLASGLAGSGNFGGTTLVSG